MLALALPATGALVADPLLGLVDTAVVGHLGAEPLAAIGVSWERWSCWPPVP
ncbi:MAG TPA: hypothetical protein VHF25_09830 [Nitriliruptorales bacterium]|nr:hypothetical protein [Nitriliruptorales bacterium]